MPLSDESKTYKFDRDDFVREIRSYYDLLVRLYLPEDSLKLPPDGGWPDITDESHAWMKKNATVVDLMKHLPYIDRGKDHSSGWQIYFRTFCVQYNGPIYDGCAKYKELGSLEPGDTWRPFPPAVLCIAAEGESNTGRFFMLDTDRGTVITTEQEWSDKGNADTDPEEIYDGWRDNPTKPYKEFFAMLKEEFLTMYQVPQTINEIEYGEHESYDKRRKALKYCGWPSENYDKQKFIQFLKLLEAEDMAQFNREEEARRLERERERKESGREPVMLE